MGEGGLQFIQQVLGGFGGLRTHDSILERWAGGGFFVAGSETVQARAMRLRPCALAV
jgi:hypothetical protein